MAVEGNAAVKAGVGYTIGNYLLKGLTFLTLPLFTRLLDTTDFGLYNTFFAYEAILAIIIGLALHSSFRSAKLKFASEFDAYTSSIILLIIISGITWALIGGALYDLVYQIFLMPRSLFLLLIVYSTCSALLMAFNSYISLFYRYKTFLIISIINFATNILASIVLIFTFFSDDRGYGRVIGSCIPIIIIGIYIVFYFSRKSKLRIDKHYWSYGVKYSLPIIPHGISQMVLLQFDRIMINSMIGASAAGIYGFSYCVYSIVVLTGSSIDSAYGPWFYDKMKNKEYEAIKTNSNDIAFGMMLLSSLAILIAPEAIKILGSKDYWEGIYTAVPLVIAGYFSFLYCMPSSVEYYYEKTKIIAIGTSLAAIINIALNFVFINIFGYIAAAYTTLFTYVLYFLFHLFMSIHIHGSSLFNIKKMVLYGMLLIICGIVVLLTLQFWLIRWFFGFCIIIYLFYWLNSKFNIQNLIKRKIRKK